MYENARFSIYNTMFALMKLEYNNSEEEFKTIM